MQKSEDVDPRDQYLGDYDVINKTYIPVGTGVLGSTTASSYTLSRLVSLTKSGKPGVILISEKGFADVTTINLKGDGSFTLEPIYDSGTTKQGTKYQITATGNGWFIENTIKIQIKVAAPEIGLNQTSDITGTKR